jgi:hypothetical protein
MYECRGKSAKFRLHLADHHILNVRFVLLIAFAENIGVPEI